MISGSRWDWGQAEGNVLFNWIISDKKLGLSKWDLSHRRKQDTFLRLLIFFALVTGPRCNFMHSFIYLWPLEKEPLSVSCTGVFLPCPRSHISLLQAMWHASGIFCLVESFPQLHKCSLRADAEVAVNVSEIYSNIITYSKRECSFPHQDKCNRSLLLLLLWVNFPEAFLRASHPQVLSSICLCCG